MRPSKKGDDRGPEGIVKKITKRHLTQAVGVFEFAPDPAHNVLGHINLKDKKMSNYEFDVLEGGIHPEDGAVITAQVTQYPKPNAPKLIAGVAEKTIGYRDDPGVDILEIVYQHELPTEFPDDVKEEIAQIPDHVTEAEKQGRVDLTNEVVVTIDGDD